MKYETRLVIAGRRRLNKDPVTHKPVYRYQRREKRYEAFGMDGEGTEGGTTDALTGGAIEIKSLLNDASGKELG